MNCTKKQDSIKEIEEKLSKRLALKKKAVELDYILDEIKIHGICIYEDFSKNNQYRYNGHPDGRVIRRLESSNYEIIIGSLNKERDRLKQEYEDFINSSYIA